MKISCLIAAYQADNYIAKALASIRAQTHVEWEVVVVEDGSRDQTEALVRAFAASGPQPVRYENLGVNRGVATARTRLLELAAGEAVAFLDADDWWTDRHLQNAEAALTAGADLVVARIQLFDLAANQPREMHGPPAAFFADPVHQLFGISGIMTSSCVTLRTTLARAVGGFDPALRIGEDRDYWLRCAAQGARFVDSGEVTCFYSKHASSTMAQTLLWARQEIIFYEKHLGFASVPVAWRRARLAHALTNYGRLIRTADRRESRRALWRACRLAPSLARLAYWLRSCGR